MYTSLYTIKYNKNLKIDPLLIHNQFLTFVYFEFHMTGQKCTFGSLKQNHKDIFVNLEDWGKHYTENSWTKAENRNTDWSRLNNWKFWNWFEEQYVQTESYGTNPWLVKSLRTCLAKLPKLAIVAFREAFLRSATARDDSNVTETVEWSREHDEIGAFGYETEERHHELKPWRKLGRSDWNRAWPQNWRDEQNRARWWEAKEDDLWSGWAISLQWMFHFFMFFLFSFLIKLKSITNY